MLLISAHILHRPQTFESRIRQKPVSKTKSLKINQQEKLINKELQKSFGRQAIMDAKRRIYSKPVYMTYHTDTNTVRAE